MVDLASLISETYRKMLSEDRFLTDDKLKDSYELIETNFGPDKLKSLDGELLLETLFNHGNKGSLVYWLEFKNDDEFQTNRFGGIAGGSAFKFGLFKRKEDGRWISGSPKDAKELDLADAIGLAREKRDLLVRGAELIATMAQDSEDAIYSKLQADMDKELGNLSDSVWVHKYYHLLYPARIDDFHSARWQSFYLIKMGEKPINTDGRYAMAGQFVRLANQYKMRMGDFTSVLIEIFGLRHKYWRVGTTSDTKSYWSIMLENGYVSIGWPEIGNLQILKKTSNTTEAKELLKESLSDKYSNTPQVIGKSANQIYTFYQDIKINDIVVAAEGQKVLGIGRVIGEYEFRDGLDFPHCIAINWLSQPNASLPNPKEGLLTTVSRYRDVDNILAIEKLLSDPGNGPEITKPLSIDPNSLSGIIGKVDGILKRKKQVIIYGPPGTGKTYWAEKACLELASRKAFNKSYDQTSDIEKTELIGNSGSKGLVRYCCFHPSYGYEDFIEGIKPSVINQQTVFDLKAGIFKTLCEDAKANPSKNYYLIIDEINRGDISRIFGELISIIETGKRGKEMILPLSGKSFSVPDNVYVVGTMNTADRSIALLDVALRRRFGFLELMPDYSILTAVTIENLPLGLWLSELNRRIIENVGRDGRNLQIGHSYFMDMGMPIKDLDKLRKVIQEEVLPLLEEYSYGDYPTIVKIIGSGFVDTAKQEFNHELFKATNKSQFIAALMELSPEIATSSAVQQTPGEEEQDAEEEDADGVQEI